MNINLSSVVLILVISIAGAGCARDDWSTARRGDAGTETAAAVAVSDAFLPLPGGEPEAYAMEIRDIRGEADFAFETTRTADLHVSLAIAGEAEPNRLVQLREVRSGRPGRVLFRALTNHAGAVNGNLTVANADQDAQLDFECGGRVYAVPVALDDLKKMDRRIDVNAAAVLNAAALADADGDGVPDEADDFPNDADRATRVLFPTDGRYTVAFEDLYPKKGDADFNDYVIQARQEEHLNPAGDVVRIFGSYRHVAKAAGYNHVLRLTLPVAAAEYTLTRYGQDGALVSTTVDRAAPFENVTITDRSDRTIAQSNAHAGQDFMPGDLFEIDIVPDAPVRKEDLGGAPYDLHIFVVSTGREIHFAGKFFDDDDSDLYLDNDGFPWALLVPVDWRWMYETQDIFVAYEFFEDWYTSNGTNHADWYNFPDLSVAFENVQTHYSDEPLFTPPPGLDPAHFQISRSMRPVPVRINSCYIPVGALYAIEPLSGMPVFPSPGELQFEYDRAKLIDAGFSETFAVYAYDSAANTYAQVPMIQIDSAAGLVRAPANAVGAYILTVLNFPSIDGDDSCEPAPTEYPPGVVSVVPQSNSGVPNDIVINGDGRFVAFRSSASDLVPGDTNVADDIFVYDRQTDTTTRVSVSSDGSQANAQSFEPALSADGRMVAFRSNATNLVTASASYGIFVHDRQTHQTTLVSVTSDGTPANGASYFPSISADGRFVAFQSFATNLVPGDTNGQYDIFVHDRQTGTTTRVSIASDGTEANNASGAPSLNADGRYVVFQSQASNLVSGRNGIFVHDMQTGSTTHVSVASDGTPGSPIPVAHYTSPSMSNDGRLVVFQSSAANLVPGDTNSQFDIFVHDRQTGTTRRVSVASDGTQSNRSSFEPSMSTDGRYVTFHSTAAALVPGAPSFGNQVYVHDLQTGVTSRVSAAADGTPGDSSSMMARISGDGRYVVFRSNATNLIPGVTSGTNILVFPNP